METLLSFPLSHPLILPKTNFTPSLTTKPNSLPLPKTTLKEQTLQSLSPSSSTPRTWFSSAQQGLAALALSLALSFSPVLYSGNALASEFDVLSEGPPKDSYMFDDAGVLTKTDLKQLLSDTGPKRKMIVNFLIVRELTGKPDASKFGDEVLEKFYSIVEEMQTSPQEGSVTGRFGFIEEIADDN